MKTFAILQKGDDVIKSVPTGFSWVGLFFTDIWSLYIGIYSAFILLLGIFVLNMFLIDDGPQNFPVVIFLMLFGIFFRFYMAFKGNELRIDKMKKKGYIVKDYIVSSSKAHAFDEYRMKHKDVITQPEVATT